jgi:putative redox protein
VTTSAPPPIRVDLDWEGERRYRAAAGEARLVLDGQGAAGPSPMQALAAGLAGCMAIDVVDILVKGRHRLHGLRVHLEGQRRAEVPRAFTALTLHFAVTGEVPAHAVERAVGLSRERYCSVWHTLRPDIALSTSFEIAPRPPAE